MRITQSSIAASTLANLQSSLGRNARLQEQLSSGKAINRASDSPSGTVSSLALRGQIGANEQFSRNANDAKAWLGTADGTLQSVNARLQRVRGLALSGSSTGNMDVNSRQAIAAEITSLRQELMGLSNTTYAGRPIFGGTTSSQQAFDPATYSYLGDGGKVVRRLDARGSVEAAASGTTVFGDGATSMFKLLDDLADHVVNSPAAIAGDLTQLDARSQQVLQTLTDVGVRYNRADAAATTADNAVLSLKSTLSGIEDIDLPKTIMDLQLQQTTYQAALAATAKVLQPSLMDFLR